MPSKLTRGTIKKYEREIQRGQRAWRLLYEKKQPEGLSDEQRELVRRIAEMAASLLGVNGHGGRRTGSGRTPKDAVRVKHEKPTSNHEKYLRSRGRKARMDVLVPALTKILAKKDRAMTGSELAAALVAAKFDFKKHRVEANAHGISQVLRHSLAIFSRDKRLGLWSLKRKESASE